MCNYIIINTKNGFVKCDKQVILNKVFGKITACN